jgi:hypothetical protein
MWFILDFISELMQIKKIALQIDNILPGWIANMPLLKNAHNYLEFGAVDPTDVSFIFLGAVAADFTSVFMKTLEHEYETCV